MTYSIEGKSMLFAVDRIKIVDIAVGDILEIKGLPGARHVWTEHDSEFMENNPDADLYLEVERGASNTFKPKGIIVQ